MGFSEIERECGAYIGSGGRRRAGWKEAVAVRWLFKKRKRRGPTLQVFHVLSAH